MSRASSTGSSTSRPASRSERLSPDDEPVRIPIEDALDLHAFAPRDIRGVVEEYLREARARGFSEVRLIHGRGIGAQRASVRAVLERHPAVLAFADAPPERGGWGATLVRLRPVEG
ncbi:MAG: Smr/MutS family protein [Candidatus Rokubacteria bacterium]|nr:Smr/MutS family protein [Candidatus Rokubacteria bacterium]MBI3825017.1 Smr/MutS family protein [Candidatus Rokubacteria bacterium]